jgi:hypothetical protein
MYCGRGRKPISLATVPGADDNDDDNINLHPGNLSSNQCNPYSYRANEECPSPSTTRSCQHRLTRGGEALRFAIQTGAVGPRRRLLHFCGSSLTQSIAMSDPGKSTISRTIARIYNKQKRLGASFFFSKGGGDVSHAGKFFTSLAVQLACTVPSLQTHIRNAVRERSDIANLSLLDQWRQLILVPLSRQKSHQSYVLVIDALDELEGEKNVQIILGLLAEARSLKTVRLRIFLTSRPKIPILHGIYHIP